MKNGTAPSIEYIEALFEADRRSEIIDPFELYSQREVRRKIREFMEKLDPKDRRILKLRFWEDERVSVIARDPKVRLTLNKVGQRIKRLLWKLQREINELDSYLE